MWVVAYTNRLVGSEVETAFADSGVDGGSVVAARPAGFNVSVPGRGIRVRRGKGRHGKGEKAWFEEISGEEEV